MGSVNTQTDAVLTETLAKVAEIILIPNGVSRIGCSIDNGGDGPVAIDAFEIRALIGKNEITLASVGGDYTTEILPLVRASGDLAALAAAAVGYFLLDVLGLTGLRIYAAAAANVTATGILTAAAQVSDGDTVLIGTQTYTFETALTDLPNFVLIGAAATDSLDNLIAAIENAAGEGTTYGTGTIENVDAAAAAGAGDTIDLTAKAVGHLGNLVVTTEVAAQLSFGAVTLVNGTGPSVASISFTD